MSDSSNTIALPLTIVRRQKIEADIKALAKIIDDYDIERIIIGYPKTLSGNIGAQAKMIDGFINTLKKYFSLPIDRQDERLTSKEVEGRLIESGIKSQKRKKVIDKFAASLILQNYMEKNREYL